MEDSAPAPQTQSRRLTRSIWLCVTLACIAGAAYLQFFRTDGNLRDEAATSVPSQLPIFGQVQDFTLTERDGRTLTLKSLTGRVWIADFFFASCGATCPIMTDRLKLVREELDRDGLSDVVCVSVSVDPARDTPGVLRDYAARHHASPTHWLFLTGTMTEIEKLATKSFNLGAPEPVPGEDQILHSEKFFLVDQAGRIRGAYASITPAEEDDLMHVPAGSPMPENEKKRMIADIRALFRDSAR